MRQGLLATGWVSCGCPARVLPDGCVDVVWVQEQLLVAGPATGAVLVPASPGVQPFGVRLSIGAVEAVLGVPAQHLRDLDVPFAAVRSGLLPARVAKAARGGARSGLRTLVVEVARSQAASTPDLLVREAVRRLDRPHARLHEVARELGVGERQLRRRFDRSVGYGWRTLSRVRRLQRVLSANEQSPAPSLAHLAITAGYADQAHMSREVRALSGLTPRALLASGAHAAGEGSGSFKTCGRGAHRLLS